jgi:hypothetical protein
MWVLYRSVLWSSSILVPLRHTRNHSVLDSRRRPAGAGTLDVCRAASASSTPQHPFYPASQPLVRKEWPVPDGSSAAKDRMASACCAFQRPVGLCRPAHLGYVVLGLLAYSVSSLSPTTLACRLAVYPPLLFLLQIPAGSLSLSLKGTKNHICVCADPFLSMAYKVLEENPS